MQFNWEIGNKANTSQRAWVEEPTGSNTTATETNFYWLVTPSLVCVNFECITKSNFQACS